MVGAEVGRNNTGGSLNAFFGRLAGGSNTQGSKNSFFGSQAGFNNTTGSLNSFFGEGAGASPCLRVPLTVRALELLHERDKGLDAFLRESIVNRRAAAAN
jgi:hypothetical protein